MVANEQRYRALKDALVGTSIEAAAGPAAVIEAAARPAEWVMAAVVGFAGLEPTLVAARRGAMVALANKEALVCAGRLLIDAIEAVTAARCCRSIPSTTPSSRCSSRAIAMPSTGSS